MRAEVLSYAPLFLLVVVLLTLLVCLTLVMLRASAGLLERRRTRRQVAVRDLLFAALMGEPQEAAEARAALSRRTGRAWERAEAQAFDMLPKIKGESRIALVAVLLDKGASARAVAKTSTWSLVRRCRGAHELGALSQHGSVPILLPMLDDRSFLVRRVAVRSLGSIGDASAVAPLLQVTGEEPRLSTDLVFALDRIGRPAAPTLRTELDRALHRSSGAGRHADLAAVGLGLIGDVDGVDLLRQAIEDGAPRLQAAAARALGRIGTPESVDPLINALASVVPSVQIAAAEALGEIGSSKGARALGAVLDSGNHDLARIAATSLLRLDEAGVSVLTEHQSEYAREALALLELKAGA